MTLPARIRDYEVWGRLGEGGMSEVYLAKHAILGVPVIIKTLKPALTRGNERAQHRGRPRHQRGAPDGAHHQPAGRARDRRGRARGHARTSCRSTSTASTSRSSTSGGAPRSAWACRSGSCATSMSQACEALHAAHQAGVVHRDVKPSNLFGAPETGIRLGDFGIAVRSVDHATARSAARSASWRPSSCRSGDVSRRTDVWGAAATACDLRYGHPPFESYEDALDPGKPRVHARRRARPPRPTSSTSCARCS